LGEIYLRRENWQAAADAFTKAVEIDPSLWYVFKHRAVAHVNLGQCAQALADLKRATGIKHELKAGGWRMQYECAVCCLGAGDQAEYRAVCGRMLGTRSDPKDLQQSSFTAWTCALSAGAIGDYGPVIALASEAVTAAPKNSLCVNSLGAALFRAGRTEESIQRLTELDQHLTAPYAESSSPAYTWYFLAMAHHKLGQQDKAKEYLTKAKARTEHELGDKSRPPPWNHRLTLELLRTEAEALLAPPKPAAPPAGKAEKELPKEKPKEKQEKK
jgi:tetratricopeptide (TPR) repeat protein